MIGYAYIEYYIITIECDDYESSPKIMNVDNALYKTNNFKIIEIEDFNNNKLDMTTSYKKNINYNEKINFWLNKQIVFDKKIYDYTFYKNLDRPYKKIQPNGSRYKSILRYYNDIIENGCSGIYKSYYPNGVLEEEYFHNNGEIEGEYKKYYENGSIKETCNYLNGLKHGKWTQFHEDGKIQYWDDYLNGNKQFDWRYITILHVPKDFPENEIIMLCD